jgi:hypothetical protein
VDFGPDSLESGIQEKVREVIQTIVNGELEAALGAGVSTRLEVKDLMNCHRVVSGRIIDLLTTLHASVRDLAKHVADTKAGIEKRRALMLAKDLAELRPKTNKPVRRIR